MAISGSSLKSPISNLKFRNLTFSTAQHVCKLHVEPATIKFQKGYFRQSSQISNFKFEIPQLTSATAQHVCKLHWEPARFKFQKGYFRQFSQISNFKFEIPQPHL